MAGRYFLRTCSPPAFFCAVTCPSDLGLEGYLIRIEVFTDFPGPFEPAKGCLQPCLIIRITCPVMVVWCMIIEQTLLSLVEILLESPSHPAAFFELH